MSFAISSLIRPGERSNQVADVQARLRSAGFDVGDEPGYFGDATVRAVRAFQQRRGILVDGIVGPHTWAELVEAGWRLGDRVLYLTHPPMRGDDVLTLQAHLNALGFDAGREDGIFGQNTDLAVRAFQAEYGVPEDGICGARTLGALGGLRADRPRTAAPLREELSRTERGTLRGALVVLDAGHGGDDRGTVGPNGTCEADLCWDLSSRVARRLADGGAAVRFSRTEAEGPEATERARRANALGADLFVSIHLNNHEQEPAEGASTYYFPRSAAGETLADLILDNLVALGQADCRSHARAYTLLKETRMPAVIVEPGFITNPDDAKKLDDPDFRAVVARAIAAGVRAFYEPSG
jgi:N-acetylmuramoyl-L-alanine amidase